MNFDDIATKVRRLDTGDGSYLRELMEDTEVMGFIAAIESRLNLTEQRCTKLKRNYEIYDYLWTTDLNSMFAEFFGNRDHKNGGRVSGRGGGAHRDARPPGFGALRGEDPAVPGRVGGS